MINQSINATQNHPIKLFDLMVFLLSISVLYFLLVLVGVVNTGKISEYSIL